MRRRSAIRGAAALAAITLVCSLCTACGLRVSHQDALDAIQTSVPTGSNQGAGSTQGGSGNAVAAGGGAAITGTTGPAGSAGATGTASPGSTLAAGGTGGGSTGGGGGSGGIVVRTCTSTASTITIGSVGEQSGLFAPFLVPGIQAVQAWVASVNAHGGVNCHPISYIVKDDGGDPSTAQSEVQQLVEQNHIVAMVYMDAPIAGEASVQYLASHGIPVIGSEGGSDWFYTEPNYFTQLTSAVTALGSLINAIGGIGAKTGKHTIGVLSCLEAALCSSLYSVAPSLATASHLNLVYNGKASLTQPDFTSACQSAQSAHVDLFVAGMDTNSIERLLKNCDSIGYHPLYITGGPLVAPSLIADPDAAGFYVASYTDLYTDTSNAQINAMRTALTRYAPGIPPSIDAVAGWASAQLFQIALSKASALNPTGIIAALDTVKGDDLGGLTYPLTFTAGKPPPRVACYWLGQVENGTVRPPAGQPSGRICNG